MPDHESYFFIVDTPSENPGIGFNAYAEAIADAIRRVDPPQFTLGIYGEWGSGKSTLLRAIENQLLKRASREVVVVPFDAWRFQGDQNIIVPLLYAVLKKVRTKDQALGKSLVHLLRAIVKSVNLRVPIVGTELDGNTILSAFSNDDVLEQQLDAAFAHPFDQLSEVGRKLGGRRVVILIDDLDRCTPKNAVGVLEAINAITDVPGFVFVLALDEEILVDCINRHYGYENEQEGRRFVEKIMQMTVNVPRLEISQGMLNHLMPQFSRMAHLEPIRDDVVAMIEMAFLSNPRSAKRYINSLTLLSQVLVLRQAKQDTSLLAAVLACELRWPRAFVLVREAARAREADPFARVRDTDDEALTRFVEQFLSSSTVERTALDNILRLTASVRSPSAADEDDIDALTLEERISRQGDEVKRALQELGYAADPDRPNVYTHALATEHRVRLRKTTVRFERLDRGRPSTFSIEKDLERIGAFALGLITAPDAS